MARKRHKPEEMSRSCSRLRFSHRGPEPGRRDPLDRRDRGDVFPLAPGVRRAEERSGEAAEAPGGGEWSASSSGLRPRRWRS